MYKFFQTVKENSKIGQILYHNWEDISANIKESDVKNSRKGKHLGVKIDMKHLQTIAEVLEFVNPKRQILDDA